MASRFEILIVDDVSENIKVAINILKQDGYNFSYALNGASALEILEQKKFDLILLDVMMPGMDGFSLCQRIKKLKKAQTIPIIFVTAKTDIESISKGFHLGAVDYVTKPFHPLELKARVATHLELYKFQKELLNKNKFLGEKVLQEKQHRLTDLELAQKELVAILSDIMAFDSAETYCHVQRVAEISKQLAILEGNISQNDINLLYLAAPLHDVGKILIDNKILHKPDKLTDDEFAQMREHPRFGLKILNRSEKRLIKVAKVIAYQHHENWDGSGYPKGLKGEDIHIFGRIVAIADVLDALTHTRSYKKGWDFDEAIRFIIEQKGKKFDPRLVAIFEEHVEVFKEILEKDECRDAG